MKLISAEVGPFCSINKKQFLKIDPDVTVLVGMNESGKTVILKCLDKAGSVNGNKYIPIEDYPRKDYSKYKKIHGTNPGVAACLTYRVDENEINDIYNITGLTLEKDFVFSVSYLYSNNRRISLSIDESAIVKNIANSGELNRKLVQKINKMKTIREVYSAMSESDLNEKEKQVKEKLKKKIENADKANWNEVIAYEVWKCLEKYIPKFVYFDDYHLLPGKINLKDLNNRIARSEDKPELLEPKHKAVMALLRMADIDIKDCLESSSYEDLIANLEAVSINLTNQMLNYWKQNANLDIRIDVRRDEKDVAPYNDGPNLYLRIVNRNNNVSTSFDQRSRGFIWFFSFLVWFNNIREQISENEISGNLILLLDEPGLALHALAQEDLLDYIDSLVDEYQVIYTTHSPFMVRSDRLHQVRVVEYKDGTTISDSVISSDPRAIFPLQAALGWTIAQNLFIAKDNLVVEGVTELTILQGLSTILELKGRKNLKKEIGIVPVGGISNIATFISLLGANKLNMVVLHDYGGHEDQRINDLVKEKLIGKKKILNVSQFRYLDKIGQNTVDSDIEDLFDESLYLDYFNKTFEKQLNGNSLKIDELEKGNRITNRIERTLKKKKIKVREGEGYNHYAVAAYFVNHLPENLDGDTLLRFEKLFDEINKRF